MYNKKIFERKLNFIQYFSQNIINSLEFKIKFRI